VCVCVCCVCVCVCVCVLCVCVCVCVETVLSFEVHKLTDLTSVLMFHLAFHFCGPNLM